MLDARKADQMLLKPPPCFGANALLFRTNWDPAVLPHSSKDRGGRQKAVPIGNCVDRLRSEDAWGTPAQFFIRKRYCTASFCQIIGVEAHNL